MAKINFFQQGGPAPAQQIPAELDKKLDALVQAAFVQKIPEAQQQVKQILQAAEGGDPQAQQLATIIQEKASKIQKKAIGGQLAYIHMLRTGARPGEEVIYNRCGGKVTKTKKPKACGGVKVKVEDGGKAPAKKAYFDSCGGRAKTAGKKKCYFGGSL